MAMEVKGLLLDPASETPVLLLQSSDGALLLPIWIGQVEANSIAVALEGIREPRPMTHDLIHGILVELAIELVRIEVWALREGTFIGRLRLAPRRGALRSRFPAERCHRDGGADRCADLGCPDGPGRSAPARSGDGGEGRRAPARMARKGPAGRSREVHHVGPDKSQNMLILRRLLDLSARRHGPEAGSAVRRLTASGRFNTLPPER